VKNITALAAAVIAIALGVCASTTTGAASDALAHPGHAADVTAINAFNQRYLKAINDGDIHALSALTDDDHIMIAPNRSPIMGKAANDEANGRAYQQFKIDEKWTPIETVVDGDLAYQRGTFTVTATPKAGGGTGRPFTGNFLRIYRRESGGWQMTRDMFNSDQPAAPPPSSK
jgi:ketosteroid isomerase-like protein